MAAYKVEHAATILLSAGEFSGVEAATELGRRALVVTMEIALPMLATGLIVGLVVSLLQALTQVQEQTLSFIPKILAMAGVMFLLLPWLLSCMTAHMEQALKELVIRGAPW